MRPQLYTEHDLVPRPGCCLTDGAPRLSLEWLDAARKGELAGRLEAALSALGFDWISHSLVTSRGGSPLTTRFFCSLANAQWTQLYFGEGLEQDDPQLRQALASRLPLAWSADDVAASEQKISRLVALQRGCEIESGLLVALRLQSDEYALVSLSSRKLGHAWINDTVLSGAYMLALCLHDLLTAQMSIANDTQRDILVSPTRQEILRQLAHGRSNKQIAHRLQLSTDTVKYHMRELRRHFNVRNRMQLLHLDHTPRRPG